MAYVMPWLARQVTTKAPSISILSLHIVVDRYWNDKRHAVRTGSCRSVSVERRMTATYAYWQP
ncbi:hypothetical protein DAEQUDRAFT_727497 [Daedalea quercina L-15889]|uniref:Uncharacterized protein n=1 Tax=Daedalea quercina L-15889 TaxID=1314783 RepID=A0A165Q098_9APHY|nr:hypothetical protein DAEQUDRAFT_727497 [Daedalea quercina L-15889]